MCEKQKGTDLLSDQGFKRSHVKRDIFELSALEYKQLNTDYPRGKGSGLIGKRSAAIIKLYFRRRHPDCEFREPRNGADLEVVLSPNQPSLFIEIKGTEDSNIAWQKLKVSSVHSHRMLVEEKIPLYRVTNVFEKKLEVFVLKYGEDFDLEHEPRWSIKRKVSKGVRETEMMPNKTQESGAGRNKGNSKYTSLTEYLRAQKADEVTLLFSAAEKVLGFPLPESAKQYQAYWANQSDTTNRPWAKAWQEAGFYVESCRLSGNDGWVTFKRGVK